MLSKVLLENSHRAQRYLMLCFTTVDRRKPFVGVVSSSREAEVTATLYAAVAP